MVQLNRRDASLDSLINDEFSQNQVMRKWLKKQPEFSLVLPSVIYMIAFRILFIVVSGAAIMESSRHNKSCLVHDMLFITALGITW